VRLCGSGFIRNADCGGGAPLTALNAIVIELEMRPLIQVSALVIKLEYDETFIT
jgi:hypothetical protein